jgi:uncharacterized circularly permuted ATP-grasp superfamily protein/uncharacterized alpha-E superfamily protein
MSQATPLDEMVDGRGSVRPHWRGVLGALSGLTGEALAQRAARMDRAFEEEGVTSLLPGAVASVWRCDPMPLPLAGGEFALLEAGLAQRATLLDAVLADIYGPQTALAEGLLPPALVFANPAFLRPCRVSELATDGVKRPAPPAHRLHFYAADLVRGPDGAWRVLADRTAGPSGIGYARENRRLLTRVLPEAFRPVQLHQLRPFFDIWQDSLQRLAPNGRGNPGVALLTPGPAHPQWFEHMYLSRELSCALVEGGDLTIRSGAVFLKTLRGLQRVDVLLRRLDGRMIDPLELASGSLLGVPGLLDAARCGAVRVVNDPGTGAVEAPALAAFLPALCEKLLGEKLRLPSLPTLWLGDETARATVLSDLPHHLVRSALDGTTHAIAPRSLSAAEQAKLAAKIAAAPWEYAASLALPPSVAPCVGPAGLEPKPIVLRLFLAFDGQRWRAMQGGLARVLEGAEPLAGRLPSHGLSKDVWVLSSDRADIVGPAVALTAPMPIRRTSGDMPSRVADNFFWLGRYLERLEGAARLVRATLPRLARTMPLPRELVELEVLARSLSHAGVVPPEAAAITSPGALAEALLRSVGDRGRLTDLLGRVNRVAELLRDRLTADMYAAFTSALRLLRDDLKLLGGRPAPAAERTLDHLSHAMIGILRLSATVAGLAAENMVRGGGRLFLDLGRRIERAQSVAIEIANALEQPAGPVQPGRIEAALRLVLELCDSVITYRSRYMSALQAGPALDLVLADEGNPRGLAFQLAAMRDLLLDIEGVPNAPLASAAEQLLADAAAMAADVVAAGNPGEAVAGLPPRLKALSGGVAALSDRLTRRYFVLLPPAQTLGLEDAVPELHGVA